MSITVGDTVGPYRIVEQLGQGGMATVFKAYHAALDRYVAIKVLHPAFKADPNFLARFQREARVVARLEHPNIVPVYDFSEHEGSPFLVMKFIPGETLKARLASGSLAPGAVLRCVEAVGAALEFAHGQGVLHRDIKPSNIMLAADGQIYLADFGLARMAQAGESTLSTDTMLGTPSYMSPEQARGDKILDAGTDIYSFGVVVYELMVGRVPFSADTPYAVIHDHIFTPLPPPRSLNPSVPAAAEAVLLKALAKDRAARYVSVGEMVADVRKALGPEAVAAASGPRSDIAPIQAATVVAPAAPPRSDASTPVNFGAAPTVADPRAAAPAAAEPPVAPPPPAEPTVARPVAPAARSPFRLRWWQIALAFVVLAGCVVLALAASSRARRLSAAGTATAIAALPTTPPPIATNNATQSPTAGPTPTFTAAQQDLVLAERSFIAGQVSAALNQLDQAVAINPSDTNVLLSAGDLALAHDQAVESLKRYYLTASNLESRTPDSRAGLVFSHAALAFYVAAANQQAGTFLDSQVAQHPDQAVPLVAQQRYQIFFAAGQGALAQLNSVAKNIPAGALAGLTLGDYYLARGQLLEATRQYTLVTDLRPAVNNIPPWVLREARCDIDNIRAQRSNAKLETTCVDLLLLLTGK